MSRTDDATLAAALNGTAEGNHGNLGDVILRAIAPEIIEDGPHAPHAWEPPEGAHLRILALELAAIAEWVDQGNGDALELPNLLRALSTRAEAACDLAYRLRRARFGTSATYGGVQAPAGKVTP